MNKKISLAVVTALCLGFSGCLNQPYMDHKKVYNVQKGHGSFIANWLSDENIKMSFIDAEKYCSNKNARLPRVEEFSQLWIASGRKYMPNKWGGFKSQENYWTSTKKKSTEKKPNDNRFARIYSIGGSYQMWLNASEMFPDQKTGKLFKVSSESLPKHYVRCIKKL